MLAWFCVYVFVDEANTAVSGISIVVVSLSGVTVFTMPNVVCSFDVASL